MTAWTRRAIAMGTDFFPADDIEATARRTGLVHRTSKRTGTRLLALVTVGSWRDAQTTCAPWAAQVTQGREPVDVSPEAMEQRMHKRARVSLQERSRQARATVHAREHGCAAGLLPALPQVSLADRSGFGLPDSVAELCPGSGGRGRSAGANRHAVWDEKRPLCGHGALPPWQIPAPQEVDTVGA